MEASMDSPIVSVCFDPRFIEGKIHCDDREQTHREVHGAWKIPKGITRQRSEASHDRGREKERLLVTDPENRYRQTLMARDAEAEKLFRKRWFDNE